ncbi:MAG: hypothetical protein JWM41_912 [Gemmatimonadetes bacterium]|nr:hypothetical protein [Gemmatimonadota bacterium]
MPDRLRQHLQSTLGGAYTIERELAGAGMSRVFVAHDVALGRLVVVKVLPPELAAGVDLDRFKREIALAAKLQHPHIVPVLSAGETDGLPYYTMPLMEGDSLRERIRGGPLSIAETVVVLRDVARALAYAHEHGVLHRDIKPGNVLVSGGSAAVTDFGIAKAVAAAKRGPGSSERDSGSDLSTDTLTQIGTAVGTPAYMAPEQATGSPDVDHRADIYAFGCLAFELLGGRPPFAHSSPQAVIAAHLTQPPPPVQSVRADVPPRLARLIMRCLEKDPAQRPQSAAELLATLDAALPAASRWRPWAAAAAVIIVAAAAALGFHYRDSLGPATSSAPKVVVVLPFENVGGDTTTQYYADGMTDELSSELAAVPSLRVVARNSSYAYRGKHPTPQELAKELHADAALQGTLRRAGDKVRVTAELSSTRDGLALWSYTNERDVKDLFQLQSEITSAIVGALAVKLQDAVTQTAHHQTRSVKAHEAYLRGRFLANQNTRENMLESLDAFNEAIAADPTYALAYVGIGETYMDLSDDYLAPGVAYVKARDASDRALAIDSTLGEAWALAGNVTISLGRDWQKGFQQIRRAEAINPSDSWVYVPESFYWAAMHRPDNMLASMRRVLERDPLSAIWRDFAAWEFLIAGQTDTAMALARRAKELAPGSYYLDSFLGYAYLEKGLIGDAERELIESERVLGHRSPGLALLYARTGRRDKALAVLDDIDRNWATRYVVPELVAQAYAALGDRERMYEWLERGVRAPSFMASFIGLMPQLAPFRGEPRFQEILRRLGMRGR